MRDMTDRLRTPARPEARHGARGRVYLRTDVHTRADTPERRHAPPDARDGRSTSGSLSAIRTALFFRMGDFYEMFNEDALTVRASWA